jgi:hypothetical protein
MVRVVVLDLLLLSIDAVSAAVGFLLSAEWGRLARDARRPFHFQPPPRTLVTTTTSLLHYCHLKATVIFERLLRVHIRDAMNR